MSQCTLVTGATGFVGSALTARLCGNGEDVHGTTRGPDRPDERVHHCDLRDAVSVAKLFERLRPARVFHLASFVTGDRSLNAVLSTLDGSLTTTANILVAAARTQVDSVVVAGSLEEYPEDQAPRYPYAAAKRAAHEYVRYFAAAQGLNVATARLGMVYGPGEKTSGRLVPHVISRQLDGEAPRIANGARRVDWIYVEDVVDGVLAVANSAGACAGQAIDIGTGLTPSIEEVVEHITRLTGGPGPVFDSTAMRANDHDLVADVARTFNATNWKAATSLTAGLEQTVDWFCQSRQARASTPVGA